MSAKAFLLAVGSTLLLAGCSGASTASGPTPTTTVTETQTVAGPVTTETIVAEPPGPVDTIEEGVWEVGADVKPGRYKLIEAITGDCYWEITPVGKPNDTIANGIPSGGRPTVILKKGQEFTDQGCGTWGRL